MFCENCGKQNPDGAAFCEHCGTRIAAEAAPVAPAAPAAPVATAAPAKKFSVAGLIEKVKAIHQKNKLIFPIAGAVLAVAVALIIVFSILGKQVSMKNYLKITMEGYDGYGSMSYEFGDVSFGLRAAGDKDCKEFGDGYDDEYFLDYDRDDVSKDYRDNLKKAQQLVASIEIDYKLPEGKTEGNLSNGDVITFTVEIDEKVAEKLDLTIKDTTFEYTVEGLMPLEKFDVLSYFDVQVEGYDGYGSVKLRVNQSTTKQVGDITFTMEADDTRITWENKDGYSGSIRPSFEGNYYNLSNGTTLKVVTNMSPDYLIDDGVELVGLEKEYAVSTLKETITLDFMDYYEVVFYGANGNGKATVKPKKDKVTIGEYEVDLEEGVWTKDGEEFATTRVYLDNHTYDLTDGDTLRMFLRYTESTFSNGGICFEDDIKTVTVSGLGEYATSLEQIKEYAKQEEQGKTVVQNQLPGNQKIEGELQLYKLILLTPETESIFWKNRLILVYTGTVSGGDLAAPTTFYFPVEIQNVVAYPDGSLYCLELTGNYTRYETYDALYAAETQGYNLNVEVSK